MDELVVTTTGNAMLAPVTESDWRPRLATTCAEASSIVVDQSILFGPAPLTHPVLNTALAAPICPVVHLMYAQVTQTFAY